LNVFFEKIFGKEMGSKGQKWWIEREKIGGEKKSRKKREKN